MAITVNSKSHFLLFTALTTFLFSVVSIFGQLGWFFELFSHFKIQYIFASLFVLVLSIVLRRKSKLVVATSVLTIVINSISVAPTVFTSLDKVPAQQIQIKRIISINLNLQNDRYDLVESYLKDRNPDYVVLLELTPEWGKNLIKLKDQFPHAYAVMRADNFGIGFLSRHPLAGVDVKYEETMNIPQMHVSVNDDFTIIAAHPYPPINRIATKSRNSYLQSIASYVAAAGRPAIVCGDLNNTPWTESFQSFISKSGLKSYQSGILSTWPTKLFPIAIPIDHCLFSKHFQVVSYSKGRDIGSDHYPIEADFALSHRDVSGAVDTR
jgi:endonuclease/exonuclease/phosphatase (EEP) superfamily protein YafD